MNHRRFDLRVLFFLVCFLLWSPIHSPAGDSTSFSRQNVTAVVTGGAVPVGTVIIWPFSTNPEGWSEGKWLECNGQAVSASAHPELRALGYANVPDFRERTLWGHTTPRSVRAAGLPNITGDMIGHNSSEIVSGASGAFSRKGTGGRNIDTGGWHNRGNGVSFDASRCSSIYGASSTVQPPALTTRFLIRAKT